MMELLIGLAILAVIVAVIMPAMQGKIEQARKTRLASDLTSIRDAMSGYRKHVGSYTLDLAQLTTRPIAGSSTNACGVLLTSAAVALWRGPYLAMSAPFMEGEDTIARNLTRTASSLTNPDLLLVSVRQPPYSTALALDSLFDGGGDLTNGSVMWTAIRYPKGEILYSIPIKGC